MPRYSAFDEKGNKFVITIQPVSYFKGGGVKDVILGAVLGLVTKEKPKPKARPKHIKRG